MRSLKPIVALLLSLLAVSVYGQQPIQVHVTVMQPVTPYLPQLAADIRGGQYGSAEESLSNKLMVRVTNSSNTARRIKLSARIERLSPSPASVSLRPDYQPSQPVVLGPQQTIQLDRQLIELAFGNFSRRQLMFDNLDLSALRQNEVNYKLPEGIYRVCVTAYDYDQPGQAMPLSTMGANCAVFNICYTASAPQFTMPVSTMMGGQPGFTAFTPQSPQIQFVWTPPTSTCGLPLGRITYDLEIREMYAGQALNDAKNNPSVFRQRAIPTNMFILDTLKYPHVFEAGKQYIVRVKANMRKMANSPLEIANQGYSELAAITYQPKASATGLGGKLTPSFTGPLEIKQDIALQKFDEPTMKTFALTMDGSCEGVPSVSDAPLSDASIVDKTITIGGFNLLVKQATPLNDKLFKGSGYIEWFPFGNGLGKILLNVAFDGIGVNTDGQVVMGEVQTVTDGEIPDWATLDGPQGLPMLSQKIQSGADKVADIVNSVANPINEAIGKAPVNMPLGLNDKQVVGNAPSTLAIMGVTFTPSGTNMRMLFNMNIPDANGWLSLAGTNFCIKPDGFNFDKGTLYLPEDKTISFGAGYKMTFKKSEFDTETGQVETAGKTHLSWTPDNGLEKVVIDGEMEFSKDALVAVDSDRKRIGERVKMRVNFDFEKWDNWIAAVSVGSDFEIASLPGFTMKSGSGMFYDHSKERNPNGLLSADKFPAGYHQEGGIVDKTFQGFYMPSLQMLLPKDFVASTTATIDISNMIVDDAGVTLRIDAKDVVKEGDGGSLGGWRFTVDNIYIPIVRNNIYEEIGMNGSVWLPISDTGLTYSCVLNKGDKEDEGYGYAFNINLKNDLEVPMWKAVLNITDDSGFKIEKNPGKDVLVKASLNGAISIGFEHSDDISVTVDLPLLGLKNLNVSNEDGFTLDVESITLGGVQVYKGNEAEEERKSKTTGIIDEFPYEPYAYHGGPNAWNVEPELNDSGSQFIDDDTKGTVAGFGMTIKNFELKHPKPGQSVGLFFDIGIDLGFGDASVLSGGTNLGVVAAYQLAGGIPKVSFDGVEVDRVWLNGKFGPIALSGELDFWSNDPTYGDGVHGKIAADFLVGSFDAQVYFGTKGSIHYGGAGGKFFSEVGIPLFGGLTINGFGGGYYYNMNTDMEAMRESIASSGTEATGIGLKPVKETSHFDVTIIAAYANPTIVNVTLSVGIDSENGGISSMTLVGDGHVITTPGNYSSGLVDAHVKMLFDFETPQFDATFKVDVNLTFADLHIPIWMKGGPDGYKLWVGQPADRVTAEMGFDAGVVYAKLKATAYLCMGAGQGMLPDFPELPSEITTFLNKGGTHQVQKMPESTSPQSNSAAILDFLKNNVNGGFMFGASVEAELGLDFFIFYAKAGGTIGFDLAMVETVPGSTGACGVNGDVGYNGYYAVGQMYAYFGMDVGVHLGIGDLSLVAVQLGAYMRGGLPNPTWGEGKVGLNAKILGVFEVNEVVDFDFGTKCYPEYNPLEHLDLIAEVSSGELGIFEYPYVVFNVPAGEGGFRNYRDEGDFEYAPGVVSYPNPPDEDHGEPYKRYYGFRSTFTQMEAAENPSDSYSVDNIAYSNGDKVATYKKDDEFAPETEYGFEVTVIAYQFQESDKSWKEVTQQKKTVKFKTKKAGMELDKKQIAFVYPIDGQRNFLKKEFGSQGYVQLSQGIKEERIPMNSSEYNPVAQFIPDGRQDTISSPLTYNKTRKRFSFQIPSQIENNTGYQLRLTMVPKNALELLEQELATTTSFVELSVKKAGKRGIRNDNEDLKKHKRFLSPANTNADQTSKIEARNEAAQSLITKTESKVSVEKATEKYGIKIFSSDFHTSLFSTFSEKMANVKAAYTQVSGDPDYEWIPNVLTKQYNIYDLTFNLSGPEGFDKYELEPFQLDYGDNDQKEIIYNPLLTLKFDRTVTDADYEKGRETFANGFTQIKNNSNQTWAWYNIYRYGLLGDVQDIYWGLDAERANKNFIDEQGVKSAPGDLNPVYEFKSLMKALPDYVFKPKNGNTAQELLTRSSEGNEKNEWVAGNFGEDLMTQNKRPSRGPSSEVTTEDYFEDRYTNHPYSPLGTGFAKLINEPGQKAETPSVRTLTSVPVSYITEANNQTSFNFDRKLGGVYVSMAPVDVSELLNKPQSTNQAKFSTSDIMQGLSPEFFLAKLKYRWTRDRYYFFDYLMVRMGLNKYWNVNLSEPESRVSLTTVEGYDGGSSYYSRRILSDGFLRTANYYGSMLEVMEGWGHAQEYWADVNAFESNLRANHPYAVYDFLAQPAPVGLKYSFEYEIPYNKSGQSGHPANQGEQPVKVSGGKFN